MNETTDVQARRAALPTDGHRSDGAALTAVGLAAQPRCRADADRARRALGDDQLDRHRAAALLRDHVHTVIRVLDHVEFHFGVTDAIACWRALGRHASDDVDPVALAHAALDTRGGAVPHGHWRDMDLLVAGADSDDNARDWSAALAAVTSHPDAPAVMAAPTPRARVPAPLVAHATARDHQALRRLLELPASAWRDPAARDALRRAVDGGTLPAPTEARARAVLRHVDTAPSQTAA